MLEEANQEHSFVQLVDRLLLLVKTISQMPPLLEEVKFRNIENEAAAKTGTESRTHDTLTAIWILVRKVFV